ncbi:hypothetical protein [Stutzerimonas nitrititolerans]
MKLTHNGFELRLDPVVDDGQLFFGVEQVIPDGPYDAKALGEWLIKNARGIEIAARRQYEEQARRAA